MIVLFERYHKSAVLHEESSSGVMIIQSIRNGTNLATAHPGHDSCLVASLFTHNPHEEADTCARHCWRLDTAANHNLMEGKWGLIPYHYRATTLRWWCITTSLVTPKLHGNCTLTLTTRDSAKVVRSCCYGNALPLSLSLSSPKVLSVCLSVTLSFSP